MLSESLKKIYAALPIIRELRMIQSSLEKISGSVELAATLEAVRLLEFDLKSHPRYGAAKRLTASEFRVNSQNGEDGIIQQIFSRVGTTNRHFVEVGVADGIECNTAFLL